MAKGATRERLLEQGMAAFREKGFHHAGLDSILKAADVPKGSFYNYFDNKDEFGLAVIDRFAASCGREMERILADRSRPALARLRAYFESIAERLEAGDCRHGCLIGMLSQEMADQSETFRHRLESILEGWAARLAACLVEARESGEISEPLDCRATAEFWLNSFQGAILRAKTSRSTAPIRLFVEKTVGVLEGRHGPSRLPDDAAVR